ncbi:lupus La protein homolog [Brevipalpus obovatus]|uniref:lupus La protein homolog n=1 Tax=Brevipalpus obovatus TaxID=246614 RepID=UPI003D9E57A9
MESVSGDPSSNESKVLHQLDYYFGDFNLHRDKFMNQQLEKNGGWIPIETLLTFNRLKALTTDPKCIAKVVQSSQLLQISEDGTKVRRSPDLPLPERGEYRDQVLQRTLHIKGFPLDSQFDSLWSYCSNFGPLESLSMRRTRVENMFKGCILAVYKSATDADKILQEKLVYGDRELLKEKEEVHIARRKEFFKNRKNRKNEDKTSNDSENKAPENEDANHKEMIVKREEASDAMIDEACSEDQHGTKREVEEEEDALPTSDQADTNSKRAKIDPEMKTESSEVQM